MESTIKQGIRERRLKMMRDYYEKNKEKIKERVKKWATLNPDKRRKARKKWREINPEKVKLQVVRWQKNNPEKVNLILKKHRASEKAKQRRKKYDSKNRIKINMQSKRWAKENKNKVKTSKQKYYNANSKKINKKSQEYYRANPNYFKEFQKIRSKERKKSDIDFKIRCNLRTRLSSFIKKNIKTAKTLELLGCSMEYFKLYFEKKFKKGMTWENYGNLWHIDHIIPCSVFDLTNPEAQKICFHYNNLQPLWKKKNIKKGARIKQRDLIFLKERKLLKVA